MTDNRVALRYAIATTTLGTALEHLSRVALTVHDGTYQQQIAALAETYRYMKQYLVHGDDDPRRAELYSSLRRQAYAAATILDAQHLLQSNTSYANASLAAARSLSATCSLAATHHSIDSSPPYDGDLSMLLTAGREDRYLWRQQVFLALYTSPTLIPSVAQVLRTNICGGTYDADDSRLFIAALLLAQQELFDGERFSLFVDIYCQHCFPTLRQQALVALLLTIPSSYESDIFSAAIAEGIARLRQQETIERDLVGTQQQLLLAATTPQVQKDLQRELLPLMNDKEKSDKELDAIEEKIERIQQMHNSGVDIFYQGFAQTKNYPFFDNIVNWFVPFDYHHPQIAQRVIPRLSPKIVSRLMAQQHLCENDKYSFFLTLEHVVPQLPAHILEMLQQVPEEERTPPPGDDTTTAARQLYIHDLYRFYTLYRRRSDFHNPFADEERRTPLAWPPLQGLLSIAGQHHVARQLLTYGQIKALNHLLDNYGDEMDTTYLKLKALAATQEHDPTTAVAYYTKALALEPDNRHIIHAMARAAQQIPDYPLAARLFGVYLAEEQGQEQERHDDEYSYALCCLHTHSTQDAVDILYKLHYLAPSDDRYRQALAWGQAQQGKYSSAKALLAAGALVPTDHEGTLRHALILWHCGEREQAVVILREVARANSLRKEQLQTLLSAANSAINGTLTAVESAIIVDITFEETATN